MEWNWKERSPWAFSKDQEYNKQKTLFKSYYCAGCRQQKPCQLLTGWDSRWKSYCCWCYFHGKKVEAQEYSDYQQVYRKKEQEQKEKFQQLQSLGNYPNCKQCGSKEVDAYSLYSENRLVCQPCLMKKTGGGSHPISFSEQGKWYKKRWGINLNEWLTNYQCLPVNADCAREWSETKSAEQWIKDKGHLNNCRCLEIEVQQLVDLFTSSLKKCQEKLKECKCIKSQKIRVDSDYSTACEKCEESISVASKKRVIKNRNDPRFWGLNIEEKVLCGSCLEQKKGEMKPLQRAKFNEYRKLGML